MLLCTRTKEVEKLFTGVQEFDAVYFSASEAHIACPKKRTTVNQVTHLLKLSRSFCLREEN